MLQSAGVAIIDQTHSSSNTDLAVLCVRAYANWDFPKGRQNDGETLIETAIREVEEETTLRHGLDYTLIEQFRLAVTYGSGRRKKTASYFVGLRISETEPSLPVSEELGKPENDEYRWVKLSDLHELMPTRLQDICDELISFVDRQTPQ